MFVVTQVGWYEIMFIFPINGTIRSMGERHDAQKNPSFSKTESEALLDLLDQWNRRHVFRVLAPFIGACISLAAVL